jgi:hypothetical protein
MNICCCDIPTCYKFVFVSELLTAPLKYASYFCTKTGYIFQFRAWLFTLCTNYIAFFNCVLQDFRGIPSHYNTSEQLGNSFLNLSVCNRKQDRDIQCVRKVAVHLDLWGTAKSAVYRDRPRTLNELKAAITAFIRNISQTELQKMFANKIKRFQPCIDARGYHFRHLL